MVELSNTDVIISTSTDAGDDISDLLVFKTSDGEYKSRALAIDGQPEWVWHLLVTVEDVDEWIAELRRQLAQAKGRLTGKIPSYPLDVMEIHVQYKILSQLNDAVIPLLTEIRSQLLSTEPGANVIWQAMASSTQPGVVLSYVLGSARRYHCGLADDIIPAINHGVARIITRQIGGVLSHAIEYYAATPLLDAILNNLPAQTIITDATPSPGTNAMIEAIGGSIHTEIIPSPVAEVANYAALLDSGDASDQEPRTKACVEVVRRAVQTLASALNCKNDQIAVITYKPWAEACNEAGVDAMEIGCWDEDARDHNRWSNARGLAIVGAPYLPPAAMQEAYHRDRAAALLAGANANKWPWWEDDDPMEIHAQIKVGDTTVTWPGELPTSPILRRWVLNYYAREYVQAIGRLRSIRSDVVQAVLVLGPVPDLQEYGITVRLVQDEHC